MDAIYICRIHGRMVKSYFLTVVIASSYDKYWELLVIWGLQSKRGEESRIMYREQTSDIKVWLQNLKGQPPLVSGGSQKAAQNGELGAVATYLQFACCKVDEKIRNLLF